MIVPVVGTSGRVNDHRAVFRLFSGEMCHRSLRIFAGSPELVPMFDYNDRRFRPVQNTANGETSAETIFHYKQEGRVLTSSYAGGQIVSGQLIGLVDDEGRIDMRYQQVNDSGELMTGVCNSIPEIMNDGRIRLHETWKWTSGDRSSGSSVLEEIA